MRRRKQKAKFWTILIVVNIVAMSYPFSLYVQADTNDSQLFATIVLLGVAFLLAITDTVSALVAYW
jgi:hypothetical protein